jgi:plasmid stabilization system protein ParE
MFRVKWRQSAVDELADIWMQADSAGRKAITAASHEIDRRLSRDPANEGESRSGGRRLLFAPPLSVIFQLEADGRTVMVLRVRRLPRRKK